LVAHVGADFADANEELDGSLPLGNIKAGLACKVVEARKKAIEEELEAGIGASRVDGIDVVGDAFRAAPTPYTFKPVV
jgi:hypothetical protein